MFWYTPVQLNPIGQIERWVSILQCLHVPCSLPSGSPSTWSPCPASMPWHHPMAWQVCLHSLGKGLPGFSSVSCSFSSFLQDGLNFAENVDISDPEDTGTLE